MTVPKTVSVLQLQPFEFYDTCRGPDGAGHRLEVTQLAVHRHPRRLPCCGAEANLIVQPEDHRVFPVAVHLVVDVAVRFTCR